MEVGDKVKVINIRGKIKKEMFNGVEVGMSVYLDKQGVISKTEGVYHPFDCTVEFQNGDMVSFKFSELQVIK